MHIDLTLVLEYVTCAGVFPCLSASSFNIGSSRRIGSSGEALEVNGLTAVIKMADILKKKFSNAFIWAKLYHNPITRNDEHFTDDIFKCILFNDSFRNFDSPHKGPVMWKAFYLMTSSSYSQWSITSSQRTIRGDGDAHFVAMLYQLLVIKVQSMDVPRPVWYSTLSIYHGQLSSKNTRKTSHSSTVRTR